MQVIAWLLATRGLTRLKLAHLCLALAAPGNWNTVRRQRVYVLTTHKASLAGLQGAHARSKIPTGLEAHGAHGPAFLAQLTRTHTFEAVLDILRVSRNVFVNFMLRMSS